MTAHEAVHHHDLPLVLMAVLICLAGALATSRFFRRMTEAPGAQRYGWLLLTALTSGVTIWCTHFVAMLGYHSGVPVTLDRLVTAVSLVIAVLGCALGFFLAGTPRRSRALRLLGGGVVGLSVASMHYVGMAAIAVQGRVDWDASRVALSVALCVVVAAGSVEVGSRPWSQARNLMAALLTGAVLLMHFTAMSALSIAPMPGADQHQHSDSVYGLAVWIAALSLVTIGAALAGYVIDERGRAASMERLRHLAMSDVLTGLPNRAQFNERLTTELQQARLTGGRLGLVVLDVDNFKEVNDLRGHGAGDEVLRALGVRMAALAAEDGCFLARIGGDEFVAVVRLGRIGDLATFLRRLEQAVAQPVAIGSDALVPRASVGAAVFPDDAEDADSLINNADLAMYRAKSQPLTTTCLYDASIDQRTRDRRGLGADLREALAQGQLSLDYQVQASVESGETQGMEALLRWHHPRLGLVPPSDFVPLMEASGLIVAIGDWVLRTACAEAVSWDPPHRVAVNVSAMQLVGDELVAAVRGALDDSGLAAERLELELTETAVFTNRERARLVLEEIKELGVGVALDDFGVGYSSLDALRSFPIDRIKIDRSFFSGSGTPSQTVEIVQAIVSLGRTFGMSVLAEGIETHEQLALLSRVGCDEAQGFLLGRPMPPEEAARSGRLRRAAPA